MNVTCPHCEGEIRNDGSLSNKPVKCPHCNGSFRMPPLMAKPVQDQPSYGTPHYYNQPMKNPGVAAVLAFFFFGLGHIYNGDLSKGLLIALVYAPLALLSILLLVGIIAFPALYIWQIIDAYKTAEKINRGEM